MLKKEAISEIIIKKYGIIKYTKHSLYLKNGVENMSVNYKDIDILLEKIGRMLSKYENMSDDEKIRHMISDKLMFDSEISSQIKSGYNSLIELVREWEHIKSLKGENAYFGDLTMEIQAMINLYELHFNEDKKDLQRARYNLETNNTIFRVLDYVLNENNSHELAIEKNSKILQLNCSLFIINYYFEKIRDELIYVMQQDLSNIDNEMISLCNRYNNDSKIIQLMYEVLIQNFSAIKKEYKPKSRAIGNFLRTKDVVGDRNSIPNDSLFILLRNCASHGEFYPDVEQQTVEAINTKKNNIVVRNIIFDEIISYAKDVSNLFNDDKVRLFRELLFSYNLTETINSIKNTINNDEILKQFGVLLMFNLIQYNNEHYFSRLIENNETSDYLDSVNIKDYFSSSFNMAEKSTFEFMQVIKNAIGHMNIEFDGSTITFTHRLKNESISSSIVRMYEFILSSGICDLAMSTNFYVRLRAEKARLFTKLYENTKIVSHKEELCDINDYKVNNNNNNIEIRR